MNFCYSNIVNTSKFIYHRVISLQLCILEENFQFNMTSLDNFVKINQSQVTEPSLIIRYIDFLWKNIGL